MTRAILRKTTQITSRLIELGRCYKGSPKGTSNKGRYKGGDDYNSAYLRFEPEARFKHHHATTDEYENLYDELKARWEILISAGRLAIRFPHSAIADNFDWENKVVKEIASIPKTMRRCDGETCTLWTEDKPHPKDPSRLIPKVVKGAKPCVAVEGKECPAGCQAKGMLKFVVPDLFPGGIVIFPLNSPVDISTLAGYLQSYQNVDLAAIPFSLFRKPDRVTWEEEGEMKSKEENWGLHLEVDPTIALLMMNARQRQFIGELSGEVSQPALPAKQAAALPPATELPTLSDKTEDGFNFTIKVAAAIRNCSLEELEQAIADAEDLVHHGFYSLRPSLAFIDREGARAREAIRQVGSAAPKQQKTPSKQKPAQTTAKAKPAFTSPLQTRLSAIRAFTGHNSDQIKMICENAGVTPENAIAKFDAFLALFRAMLIDFGMRYEVWTNNNIKHCENSFDKLLAEFPEDPDETDLAADERLMGSWLNKLELKQAEKEGKAK